MFEPGAIRRCVPRMWHYDEHRLGIAAENRRFTRGKPRGRCACRLPGVPFVPARVCPSEIHFSTGLQCHFLLHRPVRLDYLGIRLVSQTSYRLTLKGDSGGAVVLSEM